MIVLWKQTKAANELVECNESRKKNPSRARSGRGFFDDKISRCLGTWWIYKESLARFRSFMTEWSFLRVSWGNSGEAGSTLLVLTVKRSQALGLEPHIIKEQGRDRSLSSSDISVWRSVLRAGFRARTTRTKLTLLRETLLRSHTTT